MFKISINKDLFYDILSKKIFIIVKNASSYWKKELLEPIIFENALEYKIKNVSKLILTNGLGDEKPQFTIECLDLIFYKEKNIFEFHLGKILEQKNLHDFQDFIENDKDITIKKLLNEKQELLDFINNIKKA